MPKPKHLAARAFNVFHRNVYRCTGGRLAGSAGGMPVVVLTTTTSKEMGSRYRRVMRPAKVQRRLGPRTTRAAAAGSRAALT